MKKSIIISYNYPPVVGGIETYAFELISFFKKNYSNEYDFIFNETQKPVTGIFRAMSFMIFIIKTIFKISKKKYKTIHLTNFNLWFIGYFYSLFNKETKVILNLWGLELVYSGKKGFLPSIYNFFLPINFIIKQDSFKFMISSLASKDLAIKNGFNENKLFYIPLGTNSYDVPIKRTNNEEYLFFSGRITPRKGLSWFVENVLCEFPHLKLKFSGPIVDKKEFDKIISSNQVEYMGVVSEEELVSLRYNSLVVIIPNTKDIKNPDFEAFCFVTIESVASRSIVLASNYQGLTDSLLNGKLGFLAEPSDKKSWILQLERILKIKNNEKQMIIEERLDLLEKTFIWEKIFTETYNLHDE